MSDLMPESGKMTVNKMLQGILDHKLGFEERATALRVTDWLSSHGYGIEEAGHMITACIDIANTLKSAPSDHGEAVRFGPKGDPRKPVNKESNRG